MIDLRPGLGALLSLLLAASCASVQPPPPPLHPAQPRVWDLPPSTLVLPVRVPLTQVQAWTEATVPDTLRGEGSGMRTLSAWFLKHDWHFWWDYDLHRSPLTLSFAGPKVRVSSTLTGRLSAHWDTLPGDITTQVEADAGVEATLGLGPDWTLRSTLRTFLDVRRAEVPVGIAWDGTWFGETISIAGPVQLALQPSLETLDTELAGRLAGWAVKPTVETLWRDLQEPRSLAGVDALWFTLSPQSVAIGPLTPGVDALGVDLVLTARPRLTLGPRPVPARVPLPPAAQALTTTPRTVLNLPVTLGWDEAARLARARIPARGLGIDGGARVQVQALELATDADRIRVRIEGKVSPPWPGPAVDAVLWLGARPTWNRETRTLALTQVALDLRTKDVLTQAAAWLLEDSWVRDLEKALAWDLGPGLDRWKDQATQALAALTVAPHLVLGLSVDTLEVVDFTLTDQGPEVLARAEGTAHLDWVP